MLTHSPKPKRIRRTQSQIWAQKADDDFLQLLETAKGIASARLNAVPLTRTQRYGANAIIAAAGRDPAITRPRKLPRPKPGELRIEFKS